MSISGTAVRLVHAAVVAAALAGVAGSLRSQESLTPDIPVGRMAALLSRASFVFTGEVIAQGGTTTHQVPQSPSNLLVRVRPGTDSVLLQPRGFVRIAGRTLTILAPNMQGLARSTTVLVIANFFAGDTGIALKAIAVGQVDASVRASYFMRIALGSDSLRQARVSAFVARATIVAVAVVDSLKTSSAPGGRPRVETDASAWRMAVLRLERSFKAPRGMTRVEVRVPVPSLAREGAGFPIEPGTRMLALIRSAPQSAGGRGRGGVAPTYLMPDHTAVLPLADTVRVKRAVY